MRWTHVVFSDATALAMPCGCARLRKRSQNLLRSTPCRWASSTLFQVPRPCGDQPSVWRGFWVAKRTSRRRANEECTRPACHFERGSNGKGILAGPREGDDEGGGWRCGPWLRTVLSPEFPDRGSLVGLGSMPISLGPGTRKRCRLRARLHRCAMK